MGRRHAYPHDQRLWHRRDRGRCAAHWRGRFPHEARGARRAQRARGGSSIAQADDGHRRYIPAGRYTRPFAWDPNRARHRGTCCAHECHGPGDRRDRYRKGAGSARASRSLRSFRGSVRSGQLRRAGGGPARVRAVRAHAGCVHRCRARPEGPFRGRRPGHDPAGRGRRTCPPECSTGCYACFRSGRSRRWDRRERCRSTSVWLPRPTEIFVRRWRRVVSATICTTG